MLKNRYIFLDGIRGIAAILVLTRHTENYWQFNFFRSHLAVDLFFILSGFVIGYAYDSKIRSGVISFQKFALIRFIRLYPMFILSVVFSTLVFFALIMKNGVSISKNIPELLATITFTIFLIPSNFIGTHHLFPINGVYWSLFFELIANFIYVVIRPYLNNLVLICILLTFGTILTFSSYRNGSLDIGFAWGLNSFIVGFSRAIFGVFLGLFTYRFRAKLNSVNPTMPWLSVVLITLILTLPKLGNLDWLIDILAVTIIFPITVLVCSKKNESKFEKILLILGSASYPLYVLHGPLASIIGFPVKSTVINYAPFSGIFLVIILVPLCLLIEKYYDIPLRNWLSKKTKIKI